MIGIFDSGVGGLTVLRALRETLPSSDVLYFGDTKNAPYGLKSREELTSLTMHGLQLLQERGANNIVSACNSVSVSLAVSLFDTLSILPAQLIEMVGPAVSFFKGSEAHVIVCATPATVGSDIYQNAFRMIGKEIGCVGIPELAGAIESGASQTDIEDIIRSAFKDIRFGGGDVLLLGCTHYPLALDAFKTVLGGSCAIFDPAFAVAERARRQFWPQEVGDGRMQFLISKESARFRALVADLFPHQEYSIEVLA